jgi:hypothetical protein
VDGYHPEFENPNYSNQTVEILHKLEEEEKEGIGVMSAYYPFEVYMDEKVQAVYSDKLFGAGFIEQAYNRALDRLVSLLPSNTSPVTSDEEAIKGSKGSSNDVGMDTSTNSGWPWVIGPWLPTDATDPKKLPEVRRAHRYYVTKVMQYRQDLNQQVDTPPTWICLAGQRLVQKGQDVSNPKRQRLVIAYDKTEAILWKLATPPLMDTIRTWTLAGGVRIMCGWHDMYTIDTEMQKMLQYADSHGRTVLSGDVSNYDATLPPKLIQDVGYAVARAIQGHQVLFQNLVDSMIYKSYLVTPTKLWRPGPSSLKSGSGGTNLLGSLANIFIQFYGEEAGLYKLDNMVVLGDDFCIDGDGVSPEATSECFKHFGMESHPEKQFYEPGHLHYLKRLHILGIPGGVASVYRTLGSSLSLEKMTYSPKEWNPYAYVVRALSQLQNAAFNPAFTSLVNYLKSGDNLDLGARITPGEVVGRSGKPGREILLADEVATWKHHTAENSFDKWAVNGVLRGETLPLPGSELFERVHGKVG